MEAKEDEWLTTNRTTPVSCYPAADLPATPGLWVAARQEEPHPLLATQRSPQPRMTAPRLRVVAQRLVRLHDAARRLPDRPQKAGVEAGHRRTVSPPPQPRLPLDDYDLRGGSCPQECSVAILFLPLVLCVIQRGQVKREEQYMERAFGEEYLNYKTSVRRWV